MTPLAKLLAPSINAARTSLAILGAEVDDITGMPGRETQRKLDTARADLQRLEALAKATVSETRQCFNCPLRNSDELDGDGWRNVEFRAIARAQIRGPPPDWCPLRTGPVLVTLRAP